MEKILTLDVPNELWVNDFSENKTKAYTYTGPAKVWLTVEPDGSISGEIYETEPVTQKTKLEIDIAAATNKELAAVIANKQKLDTAYTYTYTDVPNHDGSIYTEISNPQVGDYYTFRYNTTEGINSELIVKDTTNPNLKIAQDRKAYILKYANAFDFESADTTKINTYISAIDTYIDSIATAYPWKYVTFNVSEIPKIPVALTVLFASLPDLT